MTRVVVLIVAPFVVFGGAAAFLVAMWFQGEPSKPFRLPACSAEMVGAMFYVDDVDDGEPGQACVCTRLGWSPSSCRWNHE